MKMGMLKEKGGRIVEVRGDLIYSQAGSVHKNSSSIVKRGNAEYMNKDARRWVDVVGGGNL